MLQFSHLFVGVHLERIPSKFKCSVCVLNICCYTHYACKMQ